MTDLIEDGIFAGLPRGIFKCLLIDPPWHHASRSFKGQTRRSASFHYQTMSRAEINALPVADLLAKNAWVFVWTTWPHLEQCLEAIKSWGLVYSSGFLTWVKLNPRAADFIFLQASDFHVGMGYTSRKNSEILILAKRGAPRRQARDVREIMLAARRQHSRKPDQTFERIERFCEGPRIEIFAREAREGWTAFGNQLDKFETAPASTPFVAPEPEPMGPMPDTPLFPGSRLPMGLSMETGPDEPDDEDIEIPAFLRRLVT